MKEANDSIKQSALQIIHQAWAHLPILPEPRRNGAQRVRDHDTNCWIIPSLQLMGQYPHTIYITKRFSITLRSGKAWRRPLDNFSFHFNFALALFFKFCCEDQEDLALYSAHPMPH